MVVGRRHAVKARTPTKPETHGPVDVMGRPTGSAEGSDARDEDGSRRPSGPTAKSDVFGFDHIAGN
jgi:hypothetical protein